MKILNWLISVYRYFATDMATEYLNNAQDLYDLERRIREIDANKAPWQIRCQSLMRNQYHW